jgi:hypothetical protein
MIAYFFFGLENTMPGKITQLIRRQVAFRFFLQVGTPLLTSDFC